MQFLKTLFWVFVAVVLVLFASRNWRPVPIEFWDAGPHVEIKLPVLVLLAFLLGFLPTYFIYRARVWALKRRLEGQPQVHVANMPAAAARNAPAATPADETRLATDSKAWPAE